MILITTAGKVGAEAARLLAAQNEPVRVLARHPEKASALSQTGVEIVAGDLEVPASIDAAMRKRLIRDPHEPGDPDPRANVVDSAARAGVDHIVKITSKASADSPIARRRARSTTADGNGSRFATSAHVARRRRIGPRLLAALTKCREAARTKAVTTASTPALPLQASSGDVWAAGRLS